MLLVGGFGLLLERHLLVGVGGVPLVDHRLDRLGVVLALDVGDRPPSGEALVGTATGAGAPTTTTSQQHDRRDRGQHAHEPVSSAHIDSFSSLQPPTAVERSTQSCTPCQAPPAGAA